MEQFSFIFTIFLMLLGPFKLIPSFAQLTRGKDGPFKRCVAIWAAAIASVLCAVVALAGETGTHQAWNLARARVKVLEVAGSGLLPSRPGWDHESLAGEQGGSEVWVDGGLEAFSLDWHFGWLALEVIERCVPHHGQVDCGVILAGSAIVLPEGDVELPKQLFSMLQCDRLAARRRDLLSRGLLVGDAAAQGLGGQNGEFGLGQVVGFSSGLFAHVNTRTTVNT